MTLAPQPIESSSPSSSAEISCVLLPPGKAGPALRERIAMHLSKPIELAAGRISIEEVFEWYDQSLGQLWCVVDQEDSTIGAIVTDLVKFNWGRVLKVVLCGGEPKTLEPSKDACIARLEEFAKIEKCDRIWIEGRRGWGRVLDGYTEAWTTFEKEL